ncbi:hypothetical protein Tco_1341439, partial [Tanacetum coccineum]
MFQGFRYSDTTHLSQSVEVLKLKNFKKDATLKLSKSTNQERYEHVGPEVASSQVGRVSRWQRDYTWWMISRCSRSPCQIQVQGTSSIQKSMITTTYSPEKVKKDEDYALMACNSSDSEIEREQLNDASIEIKAYSQGLKKVEAQLVAHQQGQLWYKQKIKFMKIDLDDKTNVLTYHKKLLADAQKEKEDLKAKVEKWHNSSKNL